MFFDVTVKSTAAASHLHDDLRLFRFFRIGSAPRFTSCPYGTEPFGRSIFSISSLRPLKGGREHLVYHRNRRSRAGTGHGDGRRPGSQVQAFPLRPALGHAGHKVTGEGVPGSGGVHRPRAIDPLPRRRPSSYTQPRLPRVSSRRHRGHLRRRVSRISVSSEQPARAAPSISLKISSHAWSRGRSPMCSSMGEGLNTMRIPRRAACSMI